MVVEIAFAQKAVAQSLASASKMKCFHLKGIMVTPRDLPGQQLPQNNTKGIHICRLAVVLMSYSLQCTTHTHTDRHAQCKAVDDSSMLHPAKCATTAAWLRMWKAHL